MLKFHAHRCLAHTRCRLSRNFAKSPKLTRSRQAGINDFESRLHKRFDSVKKLRIEMGGRLIIFNKRHVVKFEIER